MYTYIHTEQVSRGSLYPVFLTWSSLTTEHCGSASVKEPLVTLAYVLTRIVK